MSMLKKEDTLFERDENEKFIPKKIELELLRKTKVTGKGKDKKEEIIYGPEILAIPLCRGEIKKIFANADVKLETAKDDDKAIILKNCLEPKYTEQEVDAMKPYFVTAITSAILGISGLSEKKDYKKKEKEVSKN